MAGPEPLKLLIEVRIFSPKQILSAGVIGNTSDFDSEDSWFEPRVDNKYCAIDKLAKSLGSEPRTWGFEALSHIKIHFPQVN